MYLIVLSECLLFLYIACTYLSTFVITLVITLGCLYHLSFVHIGHLYCVKIEGLFEKLSY